MPKTQIEKPLTSKDVEKVVAKAFSGLEFNKAVARIVSEVLFDFRRK